MDCQNCKQEIADNIEVCHDCDDIAASASATSSVVLFNDNKSLVPCIVAFASVCLMALGYLLLWVSNAFLGGSGVANSGMITSVGGRIATALVYTAILAPVVVSIIYAVKLFKNRKTDLKLRISRLSILPKVLYCFSLFGCIDAGVLFFVAVLGNSVSGLIPAIPNDYAVISQILDFRGYAGLGLTEAFANKEDGAMGIILAVVFALVTIAYYIGSIFMYGKIKHYFDILANSADGAQYDKGNKPPKILVFVYAGLGVALAIVSFISGVWVNGIINIAVAGYLASLAIVFKNVHSVLHKTSVD